MIFTIQGHLFHPQTAPISLQLTPKRELLNTWFQRRYRPKPLSTIGRLHYQRAYPDFLLRAARGNSVRPRKARAFQASPRGGEVVCRLKGDRVELEGSCVFYLEGEVEL
jgi:hypothetical protein